MACLIMFDTNELRILRGKVLLLCLAPLKDEDESQLLLGKFAISEVPFATLA